MGPVTTEQLGDCAGATPEETVEIINEQGKRIRKGCDLEPPPGETMRLELKRTEHALKFEHHPQDGDCLIGTSVAQERIWVWADPILAEVPRGQALCRCVAVLDPGEKLRIHTVVDVEVGEAETGLRSELELNTKETRAQLLSCDHTADTSHTLIVLTRRGLAALQFTDSK